MNNPIIPLYFELPTFLEPMNALRAFNQEAGVLFLDGMHASGQFSFLTARPFQTICEFKGQWIIDEKKTYIANPLSFLKSLANKWHVVTPLGAPPFPGGIAGFFSYEFSNYLEKLPLPKLSPIECPGLYLGCYDWVLVFDLLNKKTILVSTGIPEETPTGRSARAKMQINWVQEKLRNEISFFQEPDVDESASLGQNYHSTKWEGVFADFTEEEYLASVIAAREFIHAGDSFQVNFSQRIWHKQILPNLKQYEILRKICPAPNSAFFSTPWGTILSASPERFLSVRNGLVKTFPIKGSRPRGPTVEQDIWLANDLATSGKDRAENVMIVDLMRNDLGRVCNYGSINVQSLCKLETFSNVHHLVSEVNGTLAEEKTPMDLFFACFPGGSVTGAPKIRSMEIIHQLEKTPRGIYCGNLGYFGFDGSMDTSILIRSIFSHRGWLQFGAGGGIVADSVPEDEYLEAWNKASGFLRVLEYSKNQALKVI